MLVTAFHLRMAEDVVGDVDVEEGEMTNVTGITLVCQVPILIVIVAL